MLDNSYGMVWHLATDSGVPRVGGIIISRQPRFAHLVSLDYTHQKKEFESNGQMNGGKDLRGLLARGVFAVAALLACQREGSSSGAIRVHACERKFNVPSFGFKCSFFALGNMISENL
jgi:hypothetical protein